MKKFIFILLLITTLIGKSQTVVVLVLPDNCNKTTNVENLPILDQDFLKIYPNPNDGSFYIHAEFLSPIKKAKITISDLRGTIFFTEIVYCSSEILLKQMDIKEIPNGTYILEMISDKRRLTKKFLIAR